MADSYDVVIVGGGAIGSAIAYFLRAEPGFDGTVLVVERDPSYEYCSSARATGGVRQQFSTPENIEIGLYGAQFVKEIGEHLSVDGEAPDVGFREQGYLILATEAGIPALNEVLATQRAHGADIAFLDRGDLGHRFPWIVADGLAGASFGERNEGWLDPYGLLQAFRRKARDLGADYVHDEVVDLTREGERLTGAVLREGGSVKAGVVVNTAGARNAAQVAAMAGVEIPVEPRKRSAFVVATKEDVSAWPLTIHPNGVWGRPEGQGYLCGTAPPEDQDPANWDFDEHYWLFEETVWPTLYARIPAFEELRVERSYCCHYDFNTFDQNAIIGRHPERANFFIATGFSGHGLMQSPATGRAVMELITHGGYRTLDLTRFGVERIAAGERVLEVAIF